MRKLPHNAPDGFDWVVKLTYWHLDNNVLHLNAETNIGESVEIVFSAVSPEIWRMTFVPRGEVVLKTPIIQLLPKAISLTVEETEKGLSVTGACLRLVIDRDPWALRWLDANGFEIFRDNPSDIDGLGRPFVLPLGFVRKGEAIQSVTQSFHLRQDEHLFGLGEKFTPLDKVGQRIISWTQDAFGSTSERSHKNIPFMLSTRGYGLFLDTGARVTWELGTVSAQSATIISETSTLDAYLICGSSPADILEQYALLTGHAPVPPKWTFGLWVSSGGTYRDQETMQTLVDGLETYKIPADVVHIDPWWMKWRTYCDFKWDRSAFPDVEGMIADWHERGLKICLWEHPYISVESDLFDFGQQQEYFLKRSNGDVYVIDYGLSLAPRPDGIVRVATPETSWNARVAIIDLTNPEAYKWFQDLHRPILQMGIDVFKTDFGEDIPEDAVFYNGQTGSTLHNLYPLLYNQCVFEVTKQERGYDVVWSRAGAAGNQRYPICWSGDPAADFDSLACTIRGGLSIGFSGIPFWSNDIGGYRKMPSPHLYIRWAQFGLMCSHSRMHGDSPREPWIYGEEATEIVRRYINLRYQLFPYFYSLAHEASRTGMPVIRAMSLAFPDDINTYDKDLQFMLGDGLLVAPIYDEGSTRTIYLPQGQWIDYWTKQAYQGMTQITVNAPLDTLPLFVRGGAIIPMMWPASRIPEGFIESLILDIYVQPEMHYEFEEDEGITKFFGNVEHNEVMFGWRNGLERSLTLWLNGVTNVASVTFETDGKQQLFDNWQVVNGNVLEIRDVSARENGRVIVKLG
ncbi:MAG: alpha-xylosidase [Anaerolineaceae bacterium]|nr:alpha-xylosidase [Anaerolineaceae bacterium]